MSGIKIISLLIVISSLLFSGCGKSKFELNRPEVKSNSTTVTTSYSTPIKVDSKNLLVEVVNSDSSRSIGLSGRESLPDDTGMLFDFTNTQNTTPSFWMKDMKFDIDIIWINENKIIGITKNVPAQENNSNLPTYSPPSEITHVLEIPSGWSEINKIQIGDELQI